MAEIACGVSALLVLHRRVERDECCSPELLAEGCRTATVCHECDHHWPCATVRILRTFQDVGSST